MTACPHCGSVLFAKAPVNQHATEVRLAVKAVVSVWPVTSEEVQSRVRLEPVADARRTVYWLLRSRGWSSVAIGRALHRDHGSVLFGLAQHARLCDTQPEYARMVEAAGRFYRDFVREACGEPVASRHGHH